MYHTILNSEGYMISKTTSFDLHSPQRLPGIQQILPQNRPEPRERTARARLYGSQQVGRISGTHVRGPTQRVPSDERYSAAYAHRGGQQENFAENFAARGVWYCHQVCRLLFRIIYMC